MEPIVKKIKEWLLTLSQFYKFYKSNYLGHRENILILGATSSKIKSWKPDSFPMIHPEYKSGSRLHEFVEQILVADPASG